MNEQLRHYIILIVLCLALIASMGVTTGTAYYLHGNDPGDYLAVRASQNRLVLIGTHHRNANIHRLIIDILPLLVQKAGVDTLFVEIPSNQQTVINRFLKGESDVGDIQISEIIASDSYNEILSKGRDLKMNIIAMDKKNPLPLSRDEWMAINVGTYLHENPDSKGVIIVGELHVLKKIQWSCIQEPSLADCLNIYTPFSVITWPDAIDHHLPVAMDVTPHNFKELRDPTLLVMNTEPDVSLATAVDGVILLPRDR